MTTNLAKSIASLLLDCWIENENNIMESLILGRVTIIRKCVSGVITFYARGVRGRETTA